MYQYLHLTWALAIIQIIFFTIYQYGIYKKYNKRLKDFDLNAICSFLILTVFCLIVIQPFYENMIIIGLEILFLIIYHYGLWIKFWARKDNELYQKAAPVTAERFKLFLTALFLSILSVVAIQPIAPQTIIIALAIDMIPIIGTIIYRRYLGPIFP